MGEVSGGEGVEGKLVHDSLTYRSYWPDLTWPPKVHKQAEERTDRIEVHM